MNDIPSEYPLVSIITVNYNQAQVTNCLLSSLQKITYPTIEVWVVDNGSDERDASTILSAHPWVNLLLAGSNLGFAGGNNLALPNTKGNYILYLNNDIEVEQKFLEPLVKAFQTENIGMVSPKIKFFYQPDTIQYAGSTKLKYYNMRNKHIGFAQTDNGQYDTPKYTHFAHGAAMMVSRKLIDTCGMMDNNYFLYYEELDWCERAKRQGFKIWYEPASVVYHKESISTGKESVLKTYFQNRNRLLFIRRNAKGKALVIGIMYCLLVAFPKRLLIFIAQKKTKHARALFRAYMWHLNPTKYGFIA